MYSTQAVTDFFENGGGGGSVSFGVCRDISRSWYKYYPKPETRNKLLACVAQCRETGTKQKKSVKTKKSVEKLAQNSCIGLENNCIIVLYWVLLCWDCCII